jgi:hypothetical protein
MEDQRLSTLFDYTKFHIGLYATLTSGLFGVIAFAQEHGENSVLAHLLCYAKWVAALILLAGAAGGAIASNIPNYKTFDDFSEAKLNVFGSQWGFFKYFNLAHVEHLAFWAAVLLATIAFWTL